MLQAAVGIGGLPKADEHEQMLAFAMRTLGAAKAVTRATPHHSPSAARKRDSPSDLWEAARSIIMLL